MWKPLLPATNLLVGILLRPPSEESVSVPLVLGGLNTNIHAEQPATSSVGCRSQHGDRGLRYRDLGNRGVQHGTTQTVRSHSGQCQRASDLRAQPVRESSPSV